MDYEFITTTGEKVKAHPSPYSSAQIDELLGRVLNEDVGGGVFWAECGVTTYQEVLSAYTDGKICALRQNSRYDQDYSLTFVLAEKNEYGFGFYSIYTHWSDNCIVEWAALEDSNQWSVGYRLLENSGLKVDTISAGDSIAQYPSSPAVQAYVEANKQVFWASYGTSTSAEVDAAVDAGKLVCTQYGGLTYVLYYSSAASPRVHRFFSGMWIDTGGRLGINHELELNNNTWSRIETAYQSADNRADSVDADTPKYRYPSVGAMRDYVAAELEPVSAAADKAEDYALGAYVTPTAAGDIASFDDGAEDVPVKSLVVDIEPVQGGTGAPSPENVRPISGWTGASVTRTGKNLVNIPNFENTSVATIQQTTVGIFRAFPYKANTQYTFRCDCVVDPSKAFGLYIGYGDGTNEYVWFSRFGVTNKSVTSRPNATVTYVYFAYDETQTVSLSNFMMEEGSTATDYEPYQGVTYDISFPDEAGTVYGGRLDVTTGLLTVDRAMVDLGTLDWAYVTAYTRFGTNTLVGKILPPANNRETANIICSQYSPVTANDTSLSEGNNGIGVGTSGAVFIRNEAYTDASLFSATLVGVQLVYELATPVTYQLAPTEVNTLLGVNNIHADTGGVEVSFRADPTKIYEKIMNALLTMTGGN